MSQDKTNKCSKVTIALFTCNLS